MDSLFGNNKDLTSKIGFVIVLADLINKANIVYQSLIKCKRVTRSVLALELYAMAHGFNIRAVFKFIIKKLLQMTLLLIIYTDLKLLYNCLVKLNITQKKRLIIDIIYLYQLYKRREIIEVK